jgi:hypothetical protein
MSKPIDVPFSTTLLVRDTCLCLHVQRAARALARRFDEALKPLERRGLIEIAGDPADRRSRLLKLTPAGRVVLASAVPIWEATHAAIDGRLGDGGPTRLRDDLRAVS